jgi:predicted permease
MLTDALFRLRAIFRRRLVETELQDEMGSHLEHQIDRYVRTGMSREEATRRAHLALGGVEQIKEDCRETWGIALWETTVRDLRYAIRQIFRNPAFTLAVVLTLGLGIGATTALFTVANSLLLRSLPVPNPRELVVIARDPARPFPLHNFADYVLMRDESHSAFTGVAACNEGNAVGFSISESGGHDVPEVVNTAFVSDNYFTVLGVGSSAGRLLAPDGGSASAANPSVVLSYEFWRRRFGGSSAAIGQPLRLNSAVFSVIGVASRGFTGTRAGNVPDVYAPLTTFPSILPSMRKNWNAPRRQWLIVTARLKPGVSMAQATTQLDSLLAGSARPQASPENGNAKTSSWRAVLLPGMRGFSLASPQFGEPLLILLSASGVLLILACANVAGLLLARAVHREREIAVRLALGASRRRLIRQLLTESVLLSISGGAVGLLLGQTGARAIVHLLPSGGPFPFSLDVSPDGRVLGFAFGISVLTGLLFGMGPALRASRRDLTPSLKTRPSLPGPARWLRPDLRRALVVIQVALSLVLLVGVGLLARSLANLDALDLGYSRAGLLFVYLQPSQLGYQGVRAREFYERVRQRIAGLPGVKLTSLADFAPLDSGNDSSTVSAPGQDMAIPVETNTMTPDYLGTLGIPLLAGRNLTARDAEAGAPPVALIGESLAQLFFRGESPIGQRLSYGGGSRPANPGKSSAWFAMRDTSACGRNRRQWCTCRSTQR